MSSSEQMGFNLRVWIDSLGMRMKDGASGKGGVEAISQFLSQVDWVPELTPLRQTIKANSIFYESGLAKCNKELLKRPVSVREEEIFTLLGSECSCCAGCEEDCAGKCRFSCVLRDAGNYMLKCPRCGWDLEPVYVRILKKLLDLRVQLTPEIVLMFLGFDRVAEAYVAAYEAVGLVFAKTAKMMGWERFRVNDPELRNYFDMYFFGRLAGEQKVPAEEKQILQFIFRGNLAGVSKRDAEKLIRLGIAVVKYGYLFQMLSATGADVLYQKSLVDYSLLYDSLNGQIRLAMLDLYGEVRGERVHVNPLQGGYYSPCLIMPRGSWESGQVSKNVVMEWVSRLPIFPTHESGALQMIFTEKGGGKTFLLSSLASYAVTQKHEIVFSPLNDKSNSFAFAGIPLFGHEKSKRMQNLELFLKKDMGIEITGLPCVTLNILHEKEKVKDLDQFPPTVFDRIIRVKNPKSFNVDFKMVMAELKAVAEPFGYSRPVGMVNVRNFSRYDSASNTNVDIQACSILLDSFDRYRKGHLTEGCRVLMDEISYAAPAQISGLYGSDASRSAATISDFLKESRRTRVAVDASTQLPVEIMPELRSEATNIFFRNLAKSKDKTRSQIEVLLESLKLEDAGLRAVIRDMNEKGSLPKRFWFWWNDKSRSVQVIRPCPPVFMPLDVRLTPRKLFSLYEKRFGEKVLLDSWDQVKVLGGKTGKGEEQEDWNHL